MKFSDIVNQARTLLQDTGRITYRALKREFDLDEDALDDLREELIVARRVAVDEDGKVLVWAGSGESLPVSTSSPSPAPTAPTERPSPQADRRQLTVMFCDLVGSTPMSAQLDPEDYRDIMQAYQEMCGQVLARFTGHIARYEGDGILVYFGYPQAQEDAAAQAVRASLHILAELPGLNARFQPRFALLRERPLQVRIGMHTGLVVVGEMGSEQYRVDIAVGETPNMAARVQGKAEPDEVVISAATQRLVAGLFETEDRGLYELKGIATPQPLYRVTAETLAQSRFEVAVRTGLTPLVGREHELGILHQRWTQAQAGNGQAVLVSGEPGIGKSRLVQELKAQVTDEGATQIEFRCSPYHQNSALYPITEHLQRLLQFTPDDTPETKLAKLQQMLGRYRFPQADTLPLLAALLSLSHPEGVPTLTVSPQKQKELTHAALVAWVVEETAQQPVYTSWEDLHWADPSTLEVLDLLLRQVPTVGLLAVLTFRPEFVPPWGTPSYLSQLSLNRLGQAQVSAMVERVTGGKALPAEVVQQVVTKTDGVPLFVEELTKMMVESGVVRAVNGHYELTGPLSSIAIPATLQDSLMARLDRLTTAKEVAQLGATIGREFSYELVQALTPLDDATLQLGLKQLVAAELLYQRGLLPAAHYQFKHALIQDTAYESLLKSTRRQYHQQIAQVLEDRFSETVETQPELVAHHYTEAGLVEQAVPYWQRAGQRAVQSSAYVEAIAHLTKGLELLTALPDTPERAQQELTLQTTLGTTLVITKGYTVPEVERAYSRARELCQQVGESPQLFTVLFGLWRFYLLRSELHPARELAEQCLRLAQSVQNTTMLLFAHLGLGLAVFHLGEFISARAHLEQGITLYDPQKYRPDRSEISGQDPRVTCLSYAAYVLWLLGYPDQAKQRSHEALTLAQELSHPFSLAFALNFATSLHELLREEQTVQEQTNALMALSREQGFPYLLAWSTIRQGRTLALQGQGEGIALMDQGLTALQAMGAKLNNSWILALLAEKPGRVRQTEGGLRLLAEALGAVPKTEYEAELQRLKGALTLQSNKSPELQVKKAEKCFQQAIQIAQRQQAKSWELRAATSLARLWQQQGKKAEARELLAPIYNWFTEGFDTRDLQEAKALLDGLA